MVKILARDNKGRFTANRYARAVHVACDTLQTLTELYRAGNTEEAIKLLNSDKLRPIIVVQAVQGRILTPEVASTYTSYPCVPDYLKTGMNAGKEFEELKRACRVRLHDTEFTSKFARFIELLSNRNRTQ